MLPVTYYHVVFTVPHTLNAWVALHRRVIYRLLFQTVWATIKAFGADPKRLGGELGMTAVLHTWSQNLSQHVHLHCLIPGGTLSQAGQWRSVKGNYLFPVRALSRHFRGRMVSALRTAQQQGELSRVTRPGDVDRLLDALMQTEWVVYSKACLSHTDTVVAYLARYSHRIAITDRRIVGIEDGQVRFHYKDYRDGDHKVMQLTSEEFIRRFLLHVLPEGFMRIRHYGWLANCCRQAKLERIRTSLEHRDDTEVTTNTQEASGCRIFDGYPCPKCQQGYLRVRCSIAPTHRAGGG